MKGKTKLMALLLSVILVQMTNGIGVFGPMNLARAAETAPSIIINEIQTAGVSDKDEFVELFNPAYEPISLDGFKLNKKTKTGAESTLLSPSKFSGIVEARGYFLIANPEYKDKISADLAYSGSTYYISNDNTVLLYDQNGALLDKVGFGAASDFETLAASNPDSNQSLGRTGFIDTDNNTVDFSLNAFSSPENSSVAESDGEESQNNDDTAPDEPGDEVGGNEADSPEKCAAFSEDIKINEIFPYPETGGQEFVELKNFGAYCADLSGWKIQDEKNNKHVFAPETIVKPGEAWHITGNFYLNNTTAETVYLLDSREKEADKISYAKAVKKYSFSFNGQEFFWTSVPTPGEENIFDAPENDEDGTIESGDSSSENVGAATEKNVYLNEILPNPKDSSDNEYIEMVNGGNDPMDLFGWRLKDASKSKGYQFKEHIVLNPGEYFAIYRPDSRLALNNSAESIFLHDSQGNIVSSVTFDKSQKKSSYNFDGEKWKWSKYLTPGQKNKFDSEPSVKITKPKKAYKDLFTKFSAKAKDKETKKLKYVWDFGDGKKSYLAKASHKYLSTGKYAVTLSVTDDSQTIEKKFQIEVKKYPRPNLEIVKIVPNPAGKDTEGEIIGIKNNSNKKIDLAGWKLATGSDGKANNHLIGGEITLEPNETKEISHETCKFSLNNETGKVQLIMPDGKVTDAVEYQKEKIGNNEAYMKISDEWQWIMPSSSEKDDDLEEADGSEESRDEEPEEQPAGEILGVTDENTLHNSPPQTGYTSEEEFIFFKIFGLLEYKQKELNFCPANGQDFQFASF